MRGRSALQGGEGARDAMRPKAVGVNGLYWREPLSGCHQFSGAGEIRPVRKGVRPAVRRVEVPAMRMLQRLFL